jgi:hypothetical protein
VACFSLIHHLHYAPSNVSACLLKVACLAGIEFNLEPGRRLHADDCVYAIRWILANRLPRRNAALGSRDQNNLRVEAFMTDPICSLIAVFLRWRLARSTGRSVAEVGGSATAPSAVTQPASDTAGSCRLQIRSEAQPCCIAAPVLGRRTAGASFAGCPAIWPCHLALPSRRLAGRQSMWRQTATTWSQRFDL